MEADGEENKAIDGMKAGIVEYSRSTVFDSAS